MAPSQDGLPSASPQLLEEGPLQAQAVQQSADDVLRREGLSQPAVMAPIIKPRRVESPSSINTYKHCPRKYYFQYIMKCPTSANVHTFLGGVVHRVLEGFFDQDISGCSEENFEGMAKTGVLAQLAKRWQESRVQLESLGLSSEEEQHYFDDAALMLLNWVGKFSEKIKEANLPLEEAFRFLTPVREKQYQAPSLSVRGIIDALESRNGVVRLMDYKTSKRFEISQEYRLQLAIYALLYAEHHGSPPSQVGLYFLKDPYQFEYTIPVDQGLLDHARVEVEVMHLNTQSSKVEDYPKNVTPLCKWSTGQCDFYERCFRQTGLKQ